LHKKQVGTQEEVLFRRGRKGKKGGVKSCFRGEAMCHSMGQGFIVKKGTRRQLGFGEGGRKERVKTTFMVAPFDMKKN